MGNMSYCRFRNTLNDLRDLEEEFTDDTISKDEHEARWQLLKLMRKLVREYEDYDENEFNYGKQYDNDEDY